MEATRCDARMSRFEDPVIISCSISGAIANRDQCPAIPYTPEEYAAEARRAVDEGASQIHIHARTPEGTPSYEIEDFQAQQAVMRGERREIRKALREEIERLENGLLVGNLLAPVLLVGAVGFVVHRRRRR